MTGGALGRLLRRFPALTDAALLALGAGAGQAVVLAFSPILTRLFSAEDLGVLGVFSALVAVLSVVAPLGYDQAIIGARRQSEAIRYIGAALVAGVVTCAVLPPIVWLVFFVTGHVSGDSWWVAPLIGLGTIPAIVTTAVQGGYIRSRAIKLVTAGSFINMSGRTLIQIALAPLQIGAIGLIGGEIAGRVLAIAALDRHSMALRALRFFWHYPKSVWQQMLRGRAFAFYQMPSSALDTALVWLPLPLVALAYGAEWAGIVTLVQRIGTAPVSLIGQSVVQIYHQRAAHYVYANRPALLRMTVLVFAAAVSVFLPIWLVVMAYGGPIFSFVFGAQWAGAGVVAAIWAPLVLLQIISQVAGRMLILVHRQYIRLVANSAHIIALPTTLFASAHLGQDLPTALVASVVISSAIHIVFIGSALWHYRR